jgi:threonine dehydrogenase-like Zn-dependent dehydrogenase
VEACGVCGADIHGQLRVAGSGKILGHENVGTIAKLGREAARKWKLKEGDRVAVEEYMPCGVCEFCRSEDYRFCAQTDPTVTFDGKVRGEALFYGSMSIDVPPALWGGYSEYLYLHPNAVLHRVPAHVPAPQAAFYLPMSNGVEWTYRYGGLQLGDTVLVQGPGQQGLACVITAKEAGAGCVIVSGLSRDGQRLEVARKLGADYTIDVETEDFRERVLHITGGRGVNVAVNTTGGGKTTVADSLSVADTARCTVVLAAAGDEAISVRGWGRKKIVVKIANGHSFWSVEQALRIIASGKYPLDELCTHSFGLEQAGQAIRTVAGDGAPGGIHVSILPWT